LKVKPVRSTEIRDRKIIREVIKQIRKPIPGEIVARNDNYVALLERILVKK
jgi:hypothetical protein